MKNYQFGKITKGLLAWTLSKADNVGLIMHKDDVIHWICVAAVYSALACLFAIVLMGCSPARFGL